MKYNFEGRVDILDFGKYFYTVVFLPAALEQQLPFDAHPRLRIDGEVNEHPIEGAWQPSSLNRYYLILGKKFLKMAELSIGDEVDVRFDIADQDALEVPLVLRQALAEDPELEDLFDGLTVGKKRAIVHRVTSAKADVTKQKRVEEVMSALGTPIGSPLERILGKKYLGRPTA